MYAYEYAALNWPCGTSSSREIVGRYRTVFALRCLHCEKFITDFWIKVVFKLCMQDTTDFDPSLGLLNELLYLFYKRQAQMSGFALMNTKSRKKGVERKNGEKTKKK